VDTKACSKCGIDKSADSFHKRKGGVLGRRAACKDCMQKYFAKPENREIAKKRAAKWIQDNPEKYSKTRSQYRQNNKEAIKQSDAIWRLTNPGKKRSSDRNWQRNNPEKIAAVGHRRRTAIRGQKEHFTAQEFIDLCEYYQNTCLACGRNDVPMTVDHVVPVVYNGSNTIDNIQPLCKKCNCSKGTKTIDYRVRF
jgi:5-methylcytosine-specific restriction endonuclease McrA